MLHLPILDYEREADYEKQQRLPVPGLSPQERLRSQEAAIETGYSQALACTEAGRCLDCSVNTIFDSDKCILCGGCADVCPELCLRLVSVSSLAGGEAIEELLVSRFEPQERTDLSAIIKDESKCIRCGLCAQRCPVGAISMELLTFTGTWEEVAV
jgi:ferredoxin